MNSQLTQAGAIAVPAPGSYRIDPARSAVTFTTRHLFGLGPVRGTFALREGQIEITDPVQQSSARARISAASFRTGNPGRDAAVLSARLLDAGTYPDITFSSSRLDHAGGHWILHGLLTVHGTARPVEVLVAEAQSGGPGLRLRASVHIDRYDFGITGFKGLAARRLTIGLDIAAGGAEPAGPQHRRAQTWQ